MSILAASHASNRDVQHADVPSVGWLASVNVQHVDVMEDVLLRDSCFEAVAAAGFKSLPAPQHTTTGH